MSPIIIKIIVVIAHNNHFLNFSPGWGAKVNLRFEAGIPSCSLAFAGTGIASSYGGYWEEGK